MIVVSSIFSLFLPPSSLCSHLNPLILHLCLELGLPDQGKTPEILTAHIKKINLKTKRLVMYALPSQIPNKKSLADLYTMQSLCLLMQICVLPLKYQKFSVKDTKHQ